MCSWEPSFVRPCWCMIITSSAILFDDIFPSNLNASSQDLHLDNESCQPIHNLYCQLWATKRKRSLEHSQPYWQIWFLTISQVTSVNEHLELSAMTNWMLSLWQTKLYLWGSPSTEFPSIHGGEATIDGQSHGIWNNKEPHITSSFMFYSPAK